MPAETPGEKSTAIRLLLFGTLVATGVGVLLFAPWKDWLIRGLDYSGNLGVAGAAIFILLYAVASVLLVPGSVLTLAAGFSWGVPWGTLIAWIAANLASNLSFLVGRYLARDWVARRTNDMPRFAAMDRAIARSGLRLVLLLRLSPIVPFNLLNYGLGITRVRFRDYALGGAIGMLPGTLLYVYIGSSLESLGQLATGNRPSGGPAQTAFFWGGLIATLLCVVLLTRAARKELRRELGPNQAGDD